MQNVGINPYELSGLNEKLEETPGRFRLGPTLDPHTLKYKPEEPRLLGLYEFDREELIGKFGDDRVTLEQAVTMANKYEAMR